MNHASRLSGVAVRMGSPGAYDSPEYVGIAEQITFPAENPLTIVSERLSQV